MLRAPLAALLVSTTTFAAPPPWTHTETRTPCDDFATLRQPLFGDLHVHTSFSHDAHIRATRVTPTDAYDFAQGGTVLLPDLTGASTRPVTLERPLDFAAVTDHAEFFGEVRECTTPESPAYDDDLCQRLRELTDPAGMNQNNAFWSLPIGIGGTHHPFCDLEDVDCTASAATVWHDTQAAADGAYDRSAACRFTALIGYEHTAAPLGSHLHRNVIFRNDVVPPQATSYLDTLQNGAAQPLWSALEQDCLDAGTGCDVLTIPHNSNLSGGLRWPDPPDASDAARRQARERLVEIYQHKGASECRFDRLAGIGAATTDELCTFEQDPRATQRPGTPPAIQDYPRRNMVRNTLKDGLRFEQTLGVNPFKLGFVGSTDTHSGTPGATEERMFSGHRGGEDADGARKVSGDPVGGSQVRFSPGGLAVVWAEENSRDAIFEALQRRETYATSGTRPILRFFAGKLKGVKCSGPDMIARAYRSGTPMGGDVGPVRGRRGPRFLVLAMKDPGTDAVPGTDLQRVQIVKGWVDAAGETHEQVFEVAGDAGNGAGVDPATCAPTGTGASELCTVWQDPDFDPGQRAFYYARLLENPSCRWSTLVCKSLGVDPFAPDCAAEAAAAGPDLANCCLDETNDAFMEPVIQERAWSSPIWLRPEAVSALQATIRRANDPSRDRLKLKLSLGSLPAGLDPSSEELTLRLTDDDEIWAVTVPAGFLVGRGSTYHFKAPGGGPNGLRVASLKVSRKGAARLKVATRGADLSNADLSDHMVTVALKLGSLDVQHTRLWSAKKSKLSVAD